MTTHISPSRVLQVHAGFDQLGETPLWCDREQVLHWVDIENPILHRLDPESGAHMSWAYETKFLGSLALRKDGRKLVARDLELVTLDDDQTFGASLCTVDAGFDNRLNDGRVDTRGRFWVGTMDNDLHRPNGSLFRVSADGQATKMFGEVVVSNGITTSPDGTRLYFTDTRRHLTWQFDLDVDDGVLSNRRVFADYTNTAERADGACVDVDGCIWQAFFAGGKIVRYTPAGDIDLVIELPVTNPTCVCFGGADLRTLFITTARKFLSEDQLDREPWAGSLLAVEGVGQGIPENRFG